jgi:2-dehydropantoate 2-reductase
VGTGALGTLFAARLAGAGYAVTMLGTWEAGLDALQREGARLVDASGNEHPLSVRVIRDPGECSDVSHVLVLVKAWQTERAAEQIQGLLATDGLAVTLQNGLGNREVLAQHLGEERVALGVTTTGATLLGPGLVRPGGEGIISLERHPALEPLAKALRAAHFDVHIVEEAQSLIWGKLVVNAAINPVTALLRVPNGALLERPSARALMNSLAREAAQVAAAENVPLPFPDPVAAAEEVARRTASNRSSMLQDVLRGARTEIDAICGAIVRAGDQHGIATPANRACWQLVRALEIEETPVAVTRR